MKSFSEVLKLFETLDIPSMFDSIMKELEREIIDLNQIEQLAEGIDANELRIKSISAEEQGLGNVYSIHTIPERKAKGLQTSNVDLKDTGTFWKTFKVVKVSGGWQVQADFNVHGEDIRENFDSKFDFTGLTQNNLEVLVFDSIIPRLEKRIKAHFKI
jgi:hypothetical protein